MMSMFDDIGNGPIGWFRRWFELTSLRLNSARAGSEALGALGETLDPPRGVAGETEREAALDGEELGHQPRGRPFPAPLGDRPVEPIDGVGEPLVLLVVALAVVPLPARQVDDLRIRLHRAERTGGV